MVLFSLGLGLAERHKRMAASHTGMPIFWKSELAPDQDLPADEHAPTGQLGALDGEDGLISNNTCLSPYSVWRWVQYCTTRRTSLSHPRAPAKHPSPSNTRRAPVPASLGTAGQTRRSRHQLPRTPACPVGARLARCENNADFCVLA